MAVVDDLRVADAEQLAIEHLALGRRDPLAQLARLEVGEFLVQHIAAQVVRQLARPNFQKQRLPVARRLHADAVHRCEDAQHVAPDHGQIHLRSGLDAGAFVFGGGDAIFVVADGIVFDRDFGAIGCRSQRNAFGL